MIEVSICIIICTYKRERYVLKNLDILKKYCRDIIKFVYVVDNGKTLSNKLNDDFIKIIPNINLGGSGGYARGMLEAKKTNCSHIFLMDDDIEFDSKTIHKAYEILTHFNEREKDDWIGFSMVEFDKPNVIHECGGYWNGIKITANNKGIDLNDFTTKINADRKYNYSAWWSIIMPISVIDKYGYPLPFFIKFDDIEYCLRKGSEKIHFYKCLYVKHESFSKKYSPSIEYYAVRNAFITNMLHSKNPIFCSLLRYVLRTSKMYLKFNYRGIRMANLGIKDFLKGPTILSVCAREEHNENIKRYANKKVNYFLYFVISPFVVLANVIKVMFKRNKIKNKYRLIQNNIFPNIFKTIKNNIM